MLKSLTCDQSSFKSVTFRDGLNLIVADRTTASAQKGTRNGSGKTALIEIIHHCLGAGKASGEATLAHSAVQGWKFTLGFTAGGRTLIASRTVGSNDVIVTGEVDGLPLGEDGVLERQEWTKVLGELMFGITPDDLERRKKEKE